MPGDKDKGEDEGLDVNRKPKMDAIHGIKGEPAGDDDDEKPSGKDER